MHSFKRINNLNHSSFKRNKKAIQDCKKEALTATLISYSKKLSAPQIPNIAASIHKMSKSSENKSINSRKSNIKMISVKEASVSQAKSSQRNKASEVNEKTYAINSKKSSVRDKVINIETSIEKSEHDNIKTPVGTKIIEYQFTNRFIKTNKILSRTTINRLKNKNIKEIKHNSGSIQSPFSRGIKIRNIKLKKKKRHDRSTDKSNSKSIRDTLISSPNNLTLNSHNKSTYKRKEEIKYVNKILSKRTNYRINKSIFSSDSHSRSKMRIFSAKREDRNAFSGQRLTIDNQVFSPNQLTNKDRYFEMKNKILKLKRKYVKADNLGFKKKTKRRIWSPEIGHNKNVNSPQSIIKEKRILSPKPEGSIIQSKLNKIRSKVTDGIVSEYVQKALSKGGINSMTLDERSNKIRDEINSVEEMLSYEQNFKHSSKENKVKNLMTRLLSP